MTREDTTYTREIEEGIVARVETTSNDGKFHHHIATGRFYENASIKSVMETLAFHEEEMRGTSMRYTTQLNSCGIKKTRIEYLN